MHLSFSDQLKLSCFLGALLLLAPILNVVKITTPVSAATNTYVFKIISNDGRVLHSCSEAYDNDGVPSIETAVTEAGLRHRVEIYQVGVEYPICTSGLLNLSDITDSAGNYSYKLQMYNRSGTLIAESSPFYFTGSGNYAATMRIVCDETKENCTATTSSSTGQTTAAIDSESLDSTSICSKAAKGAGWILCTVSDLLTGALDGLYGWAENLLQINSSMLATRDSSGNRSGAYTAWGYFRNFANILFVVFLLIVIFSQLTGVGIDNYGIKKSLPRLVAAALLVNLSYYICMLAIDVSNIVGAGITNVFDSINVSVNLSGDWSVANTAAAIGGGVGALGLGFAGLISAGGGIAALGVAGFGATLGAGAIAALIGFLGAVISAVTALLMMVVLLGARWGIVLIGVTVAPVAFVCYMLPNTKSVFDKWLKLMEAMLFLYPTCSLAIAGGKFASKVILSTNSGQAGFLLVLVASIVQIVPYFFVPTMVRGAFRMAGNLGAVATRFGSNLGRAGRGALANTRIAQRSAANVEANRRQTVDMNKIRDAQRRAGLPEMTRREARQYFENQRAAEANRAILAADSKAREDEKYTDKDYVAGVRAKQVIEAAADKERTRSYAGEVLDVNGEVRADVQNATIQQAVISQEGQLKGTLLYDDANYQATKRGQQENAIRNETTKMYMDQFSTMDTVSLQTQLKTAMQTTGPHQSQQISAAIQTLMSRGSEKEILESLADVPSSDGLRDAMRADGTLRNLVSQQFLSSGNTIMKEYGKHVVANGGSMNGFADFVDGATGTGSLADALQKKGNSALTGMNKDNLDFLSNHMAAVSSLDGKTLANAMAATSNGEEIQKFVDMVNKMSATQKQGIIQNMSAAQFVSTNDSIRRALGRQIDFTNQIDQLRQPQNAQLAAQLSQTDRTRYGL